MKIKTSKASGLALDWGVAVVLGYTQLTLQVAGKVYGTAPDGQRTQIKHIDPAVCMGLIEQYKPDVVYRAEEWGVEFPHNNNRFWSPCLARAVARCVISMKLGDEFEVPDELGVQL